jgi:16S rRNA (guanine(966)-N(2))-methyltransferase RsmD
MLVSVRIIAGSLRSRTLNAPAGLGTRPTSDRLRETLFNVVAPRIAGAHFLDLYAGSGAVGLEALSRGAAQATFVERAPAALAVLRGNLEKLGLSEGFRIHAGSVKSFLQRLKPEGSPGYDVIFLDPPYEAEEEYAGTLGLLGGGSGGWLAPGALVIVEHRSSRGRKELVQERYGRLKRTRLLEQGDAALSFYVGDAGESGE